MKFHYASLRVDSLGVLAAIALTAGAAFIAIGPRLLARAPSPDEQKADLERRRLHASDLDKQVETTRRRLTELAALNAAAVQLEPASRVNERLVEITKLAGSGTIAIVQMTPGAPVAPSEAHADRGSAPIDAQALVVPIKLAGTGSYPDVERFVHALREKFRDTAVMSLKLNAQPVAPDSVKPSENVPGSFTIDLAWYAAPAGSAGAPANP